MNVPFEKLVGAGNDFVFVWASDLAPKTDRPAAAITFCDRQFGVGADGWVVMSVVNESANHYAWDFYNNDGSKAEMCGNAARCAIQFLQKSKNIDHCQLNTSVGLVTGNSHPSGAQVSWTLASDQTKELTVDLEDFKSFKGVYINTGVPHFVILNEVTKVTSEDCLAIQKHPSFGEPQTNVTLLDTSKEGLNKTRTFERGVKSFTLACGTGVIASAFVLQQIKKLDLYSLTTPGGNLEVQLNGPEVTLTGPADVTFSGTFFMNEVSHD